MLTVRDYVVAEFRGNFPQIATAQSVQMDALTQGDEDPFFVTLPVAVVGATSENGLHYDEALVSAIGAQMVGRGGLMGHLDKGDRETAFPIEAVDWIGMLRQGATLWGKGYIPPGEAREYIRRLKARGGQLATSIYGPYAKQTKRDDGSWLADGLQLESLDLAPADRAALKLGGDFNVTAQMDNNSQEDNEMEKEQILAELKAEEIPAALRDQIIANHTASAETTAKVAELETSLAAEQARVVEFEAQIVAQSRAVFDAALETCVAEMVNWRADTDEAKTRVAMVRLALSTQIVAEMGDDLDVTKIAEVAKTAWESEAVKPLAELVKTALGGPRAVIGGSTTRAGELVDTPAARQEARRRTGI